MNSIESASSEQKILLKAPLSGHLISVEAVPNPVFAGKMVGDGISVDACAETRLRLAPKMDGLCASPASWN